MSIRLFVCMYVYVRVREAKYAHFIYVNNIQEYVCMDKHALASRILANEKTFYYFHRTKQQTVKTVVTG